MILKYKTGIAVILSGIFMSGTAYALNLAEFVKGIAADVSVVTKNGSCAANPYNNDAPCLPTILVCPVGKSPIPVKKISCAPLYPSQSSEFQVLYSKDLATATTSATNFVQCNPMSTPYFITPDPNAPWFRTFVPAKAGYSPLCDPITKVCKLFNYKVTARCVTTPNKADATKLGIKLK